MENNPKVFISYSHDNQEHIDRVLNLSNALRDEGIDCILDQYEESPEEGWPRWTDRNITNSDYVLVVSTETYFKRVTGTEEDGIGYGVTWEGNLIYQHLYNAGTKNKKFIPILFDKDDKKFIPTPIAGSSFYILDNDYDKLYWRLRGIASKEKPKLGELRKLPQKERKTMFFSGLMRMDLWDKADWKGVAYLISVTEKQPPILAVAFKNFEYAVKIFEDWNKRIGTKDIYEEIRVSIVEGDAEEHPTGYYVHIGGNVENISKKLTKQNPKINFEFFMMTSRFHRMDPEPTSKHLTMFKEAFQKYKCYYLMPGLIDDKNQISLIKGNYILKTQVEFRHINDITSKQDFDCVLKNEYRDDI